MVQSIDSSQPADSSPKNKHWTRYAAIFPLGEVNLMERQLLFLLDFDLSITEPELLLHFAPFLTRVTVRSRPTPRSRPPPSTALSPSREVACEQLQIPPVRRFYNEQLPSPPASRQRSTSRHTPPDQVSPCESSSSSMSSTASPITPLDDISPKALLPPIHAVATQPPPPPPPHPHQPYHERTHHARPASVLRTAFQSGKKHLGRRPSGPPFSSLHEVEATLL